MNIQTSFMTSKYGKLYVVPTPIGNLRDITYRAIDTLQKASLIAAEDTRHTKKLLNHYEITTPLISYHEHNEKKRAKELTERLLQGKDIALVSDAGMPGISDPGHILIKQAIDQRIDVVVLPGANAALTALIGSGLLTEQFLFYGFLPRKQKDKRDTLKQLKSIQATLIFYESPYRIKDTIETLYKQLGNRKVVIARELTKQYETFIRGKLSKVVHWLDKEEAKILGECCILVAGNEVAEQVRDKLWWSSFSVIEHVDYYIEEKHFSTKDAIKQVAKERHMKRRDVYQIFHQM